MAKSAAGFKRVFTLVLPSGEVVEARKPNISRLIMENALTVPDILTDQVASGLNAVLGGKTDGATAASEVIERLVANMPVLSGFIDLVMKATLVWPKIVEHEPDYENGEINIGDLDEADRLVLFRYALPTEQVPAPEEPKNSEKAD